MDISYQLTGTDHTDAAFLASKARRTRFFFDFAIVLGLALGGVILLCSGLRHLPIGVVMLWLSWFFVRKRFFGWKTWAPAKGTTHKTIAAKFSEEAFECHHLDFDVRLPWQYFSHFLENDTLFVLIIRTKRTFLIVPKRAFADERQLNEARRYLGKIIYSASTIPPIANPS